MEKTDDFQISTSSAILGKGFVPVAGFAKIGTYTNTKTQKTYEVHAMLVQVGAGEYMLCPKSIFGGALANGVVSDKGATTICVGYAPRYKGAEPIHLKGMRITEGEALTLKDSLGNYPKVGAEGQVVDATCRRSEDFTPKFEVFEPDVELQDKLEFDSDTAKALRKIYKLAPDKSKWLED